MCNETNLCEIIDYEKALIAKYKLVESEYDNVDKEMFDYFMSIVDRMLSENYSTEDIKQRIRVMPQSTAKILIFKKIIDIA